MTPITNIKSNIASFVKNKPANSRLGKSIAAYRATMQKTTPPNPLGNVHTKYRNTAEDAANQRIAYHGTTIGRLKKVEGQKKHGVFKKGIGDLYFGGPEIAGCYSRGSDVCEKPCGKCGSECKNTPVIAKIKIPAGAPIYKNEFFGTYYLPSEREDDVEIETLYHANPDARDPKKNKTKIERVYLSMKAAFEVLAKK